MSNEMKLAVGLRESPRILIVEDSDINRRLAQHLLAQVGYPADAVANGREAIHAYRQGAYGLILMDCRLPGSPQFMATRIIRLIEAQQDPPRRAAIIGLTAFAPPGFQERCLQAGMDACYVKPFRDKMMQEILARWLPAARHPEAA